MKIFFKSYFLLLILFCGILVKCIEYEIQNQKEGTFQKKSSDSLMSVLNEVKDSSDQTKITIYLTSKLETINQKFEFKNLHMIFKLFFFFFGFLSV